LQYVSIGGSLVLLIAGILVKWKPRAAAFTAIGASVAIWCFYAPALIHTLSSLPTGMTVQAFWAFTPVVLLIVGTAHALIAVARTSRLKHF
jgi:hypothetical protein